MSYVGTIPLGDILSNHGREENIEYPQRSLGGERAQREISEEAGVTGEEDFSYTNCSGDGGKWAGSGSVSEAA